MTMSDVGPEDEDDDVFSAKTPLVSRAKKSSSQGATSVKKSAAVSMFIRVHQTRIFLFLILLVITGIKS